VAPLADSFIIVFDELSDERREVAHALIKEKSSGWWHNMPNVWIAGGHNASYWRDELKPIVAGTSATILVMRLPSELPQRHWAFFGPKAEEKTLWLKETYSGRPEEAPQPNLLS